MLYPEQRFRHQSFLRRRRQGYGPTQRRTFRTIDYVGRTSDSNISGSRRAVFPACRTAAEVGAPCRWPTFPPAATARNGDARQWRGVTGRDRGPWVHDRRNLGSADVGTRLRARLPRRHLPAAPIDISNVERLSPVTPATTRMRPVVMVMVSGNAHRTSAASRRTTDWPCRGRNSHSTAKEAPSTPSRLATRALPLPPV
jgi:hypothetical protein